MNCPEMACPLIKTTGPYRIRASPLGWRVTDDVLYMFAKLDYETPTYEVS